MNAAANAILQECATRIRSTSPTTTGEHLKTLRFACWTPQPTHADWREVAEIVLGLDPVSRP